MVLDLGVCDHASAHMSTHVGGVEYRIHTLATYMAPAAPGRQVPRCAIRIGCAVAQAVSYHIISASNANAVDKGFLCIGY